MKSNMLICICLMLLMFSCDHTSMDQRLEEFAKRESVFLEALNERGGYESLETLEKGNKEFANWLFEDTCAFYYDFPVLTDSTDIVNIAATDDNNVRIYSWDTQLGGTMIHWDNIIQYRSNGKLKSFDGSIWKVDRTPEEQGEMDFGCWTKSIYAFQCNDGQTIYVTESYFRASSMHGYSTLDAFCISDGTIKMIDNAFVIPNENYHTGIEYIIPSWYFLTDGKGWDWIFSLDKKTQTFYVPVVDEMYILDQYDLYTFNGNQFVYSGREGGYWLHPSLRKFDRLVKLTKTGNFLIRIDQVSPNTYRYASWSGTEDMSRKPDIVIENGKYNDEEDAYHFINDDYTYYVSENEECTVLSVMQKDKVILSTKEVQNEEDDN